MMKYGKIIHGRLIKKINRFIAEVYINEVIERVHIKNTGRLKELFIPGSLCILEISNNPNRKTKYSLVAIYKNEQLVNIDSQIPNAMVFEALSKDKINSFKPINIKREVFFKKSRFDLYLEIENQQSFIEVKGVTLEKDRVAMFPDAPTERGTKHVLELIEATHEGYTCAVLFVIQMKGCVSFTLNKEMDPLFTDAVIRAKREGVEILAYDSIVEENQIVLDQPIPVILPQ